MLCVYGRAIAVDLELTWQYPLSEFCSKQAGGRRSVNPFTMSHNGSPYDLIRVIHVATYARIACVANYQLSTSSAAGQCCEQLYRPG